MFIYLIHYCFLCVTYAGQSNLMASANAAAISSAAAQVNVNGSTYHTVYINPHPSMAAATTAPITSTFLYHHPSAAGSSHLSHPHHPPAPAHTSALTGAGTRGEGEDRVTSTTSWNVTGQCTSSSPYAGEFS